MHTPVTLWLFWTSTLCLSWACVSRFSFEYTNTSLNIQTIILYLFKFARVTFHHCLKENYLNLYSDYIYIYISRYVCKFSFWIANEKVKLLSFYLLNSTSLFGVPRIMGHSINCFGIKMLTLYKFWLRKLTKYLYIQACKYLTIISAFQLNTSFSPFQIYLSVTLTYLDTYFYIWIMTILPCVCNIFSSFPCFPFSICFQYVLLYVLFTRIS